MILAKFRHRKAHDLEKHLSDIHDQRRCGGFEGNGGDDKLSGGPDVKDGCVVCEAYFHITKKIYTYIHTWHPNDPCFGGKRHCFWGLTFKIEVIWVPGIYI